MAESFNSKSSEQNSYFQMQNFVVTNEQYTQQGNSFGQKGISGNSFGVQENRLHANSGQQDIWKNSLGQECVEDQYQQQIFPLQFQFNNSPHDFFTLGDQLEVVGKKSLSFVENIPGNVIRIPNMDFIPASGEQLASKFKPEIRGDSASQAQGVLQSNLFNVNHAKSLYTNKISRLVDRPTSPNTSSLSPHSSKSQQKYQRKVSGREKDSDYSSNELNSQVGQLSISDAQQLKLAKNRESARNSRNRKKIYVELLETKVTELQQECERLKEICRKYETTIQENSKNAKMFTESQQQLFSKLDALIQEGKSPEIEDSQIGLLLDALRFRIGSNSKERVTGTKHLINEMIDLALPVHSRYILKSSDTQKDMFSPNFQNVFEWSKLTCQKLELTSEQLNRINKLRPKFKQLKDMIQKVIEQIYENVDKVHFEASRIDQQIDILFRELKHRQVAQILLCVNQNGFRKDIQTSSIFSCLNSSMLSNEDEDDAQFQIEVEEHDALNIKIESKQQVKLEDEQIMARKQIKKQQ